MGETVASGPIQGVAGRRTLGAVHAFFVRAADERTVLYI
jgi:hypothetical protein